MPLNSFSAVDIPVPSWLEKTSVAQKMVINGIPSTVYHFIADRDVEEVLKFYRQRWDESSAGRAGYREAMVAPWHVISRLDGRYLLTVQVQEKDKLLSMGYLAIADLKEIKREKNAHRSIPKLAGSKVVNDLVSYDPGKKAKTLMLVNEFSVATNGNFYHDYYLDRGWGQLQDQKLSDARVLAFSKSGAEVHLVINKTSSGSVVVMNQVVAD